MPDPENGPTPAPVEELIGWVRGDRWWIDGQDKERRRAEVDDLADWLAEQGWPSVRFNRRTEHVRMSVKNHNGHIPDDRMLTACLKPYPSRLAALEAAVRAVHEQENT